jgi:hypothetical protein
MIIGLTGLPRSGKSTVALYLAQKHFVQLAFADPLKTAAALLLERNLSEIEGLNGFDREAILPEWGFSTRWFLQRFGTECMRNQIREDFWVQHMRNRLKTLMPLYNVVITDVRFGNEVALVHEMGGFIAAVERPDTVSNGHVSDQRMPHDYLIHNSGTLADLQYITESLLVDVSARNFGHRLSSD